MSGTKPVSLENQLNAINRDYIFVQDPVGILYVPTRKLLTSPSFNLPLRNKSGFNGKENVKVAPAWLSWEKRRECSELVYEPALEPGLLPDRRLNLWPGLSVQPIEGDITPWVKLLDHIFRDDPEARKWFEHWVAYPIQHPGTKLSTAVLLWGVQGAGKSLLGETIGGLYGENYYELSQNDLVSDFNDWLSHRQFVLVNEIVSTGRQKQADHLKGLITRQHATVNIKYQPTYKVRDCVNYFITSNHANALCLDDDDRRFFVYRVKEPIGDKLANGIGRWNKTREGRAALLHHLHSINLDGFNPHAHASRNAAKEAMIEASRTDLEQFIGDRIEAARNGEQPELTSAKQIRDEFAEQFGRTPTIQEIRGVMQKLGALPLDQVRVPGGKVRAWALINQDKWKQALDAEIAAQFQPHHKRPGLRPETPETGTETENTLYQ